MSSHDLAFHKDSLLGPLHLDRVHQFEEWISRFNGVAIELDAAYLSHLAQFHGGIPRRACFKTSAGRERLVVRFLNFQEEGERQAEYSVEATYSLIASTRLGHYLVPFAELFAGDFLCFDYTIPGRPEVVVWLHELSGDEDGPSTEFVASTFDEFMDSLYEA